MRTNSDESQNIYRQNRSAVLRTPFRMLGSDQFASFRRDELISACFPEQRVNDSLAVACLIDEVSAKFVHRCVPVFGESHQVDICFCDIKAAILGDVIFCNRTNERESLKPIDIFRFFELFEVEFAILPNLIDSL